MAARFLSTLLRSEPALTKAEWIAFRDEHAANPTKAWDILKVRQAVKSVSATKATDPVPPGHVRLVCISDTHGLTDGMVLPHGDILVHAGDFSNVGSRQDVVKFNDFLSKQPHKHKIVIAGNHDVSFDAANYAKLQPQFHARTPVDPIEVKSLLTACTYLEDSACEVEGLKFYGSPWSPWFGGWAFNAERGEPIRKFWTAIPSDVNVLITHGPPIGHGDLCSDSQRAGCVDLLCEIQTRIRPNVHVFGHIHEGYGITTDGVTKFVNASTCTLRYKPTNSPIVVDVKVPE